jgi:4-amino-4-deoxy-L-arabinose transferase-like glycosyltransferase
LTAVCAAIALGALLIRVVSIVEPLGIDQSLWASAVRGMSRGQLLYRDVWEQRPPGIYVMYLWACRLFGWTAASIAWLDILSSAATAALLYLITRTLSTRLTGAVAAALYAALTIPAELYPIRNGGGILERSVCETFIVVCVCLGAWCAVRFRDQPSTALACGVGLFAGAAIVFKPNAGLYLPALLLWIAWYRRESPGAARPRVGRWLALAAVASGVLPAITIGWLWHQGVLAEARIAVVDFNRFYVSQGYTAAGMAAGLRRAVGLRIKTDPLWLAGVVGAGMAVWELARTRRLAPVAGLAVIWGGAAALVIIVNGVRLFNSYFIQATAPLAILAAWLLTDAARASWPRRLIGVATGAAMVFLLVSRHYPGKVFETAQADLAQLLGRSDRAAYLDRFGAYGGGRGYSARANDELASYVRAHTSADERIFLFGISGAGVYFSADRLPAQRFLRVNFFVPESFPDPRFSLSAVLAELAARRPRYLVFERLHSAKDAAAMADAVDHLTEQPDVMALLGAYRLETQIEDFTLYRRLD